jgi:hypothetical protein
VLRAGLAASPLAIAAIPFIVVALHGVLHTTYVMPMAYAVPSGGSLPRAWRPSASRSPASRCGIAALAKRRRMS